MDKAGSSGQPNGERRGLRAFTDRLSAVAYSRDTPAVMVSALIHAVLLLVLALCALPVMMGRESLLTTSSFVSDYELLEVGELDELEFPAESIVDDELPPSVEMPLSEPAPLRIDSPVASLDVEPSPQPERTELGAVGPGDTAVSASEVASEASTVEGAVDTVTGRIKAKLEQGDLLVVWLLDASHSLVDDRRRVAEHLEPFFDEIATRRGGDANHQLLNAVVSFGKSMRQRVAPTTAVSRIVKAVEKLPIDRSGEENVFSAISNCARQYRDAARGEQIMIVVWMDETGDDTELLEEAIQVCREQGVSVSVVGPSSVLGAETGFHSYRDPKTKTVFQLPVKRGPDSPLPERIDLGYWFLTRPPGAGGGVPRDWTLPSWYGGHHLRGIASGFSPHALTRLAGKTGGTYTIFDRPEDRGPFRSDAMLEYAPQYQSHEDYLITIAAHPLRRAVHRAVEVTHGKTIMPPENMLFVSRDDPEQPFNFTRPYLTPAVFATKLRAKRRGFQRTANRQTAIIEEALGQLSSDGDPDGGLEEEFSQETSPRWRAWYDLTRGRLLATTIRLEEYRLALDSLKDGLKSSTNHVVLMPAQEMRSSMQSRAVEAERLLRRCVAEHPDTPWEYLAERELAYGLGIFIRQMSLVPVPSGPAGPRASLPKL